MLRSMKDLETYSIVATDGTLGQVRDFYFDDSNWVIRYLIARVGEEAAHRKVLISPISIGAPNWSERIFPLTLTQSQVAHSPDIDTDKPVSRQQEVGYFGYYGYGNYWGGGGLWGAGMYPDILQAGLQKQGEPNKGGHPDDPHLRSGNAVMRYYVHASDGDIGHVDGFLIDERSWSIRYMMVNTSNWWLGHTVLIAPRWIDDVRWTESMVMLDMTRDSVKHAPPFHGIESLDRDAESALHAHYAVGARADLNRARLHAQTHSNTP
jgi:hypothetical protein